MAAKSFSKKATVVPNDFSEEVDSSESDGEIRKITRNLRSELTINNELSLGEATNNEENIQSNNQKRKRDKTVDWKKKDFVVPAANFAGTFHHHQLIRNLNQLTIFILCSGKTQSQF